MEPQLPYTIKRAAIAAASNGDNELVAAVTGKKLRLLALELTAAEAVNGKLQSDAGAGAVDLTGLHYFGATGPAWSLPYNAAGWCETASGKKLNLSLSAAKAVGGALVYAEV